MKKYKLVIISLLLLIFMVGAVSAADENVTDDNLEISDEISVDEEAVASSDVEDEVLSDSEIPAIIVEDDYLELDEIKLVYGDEKDFTVQFLLDEDTPISDMGVEFHIYSEDNDEWFMKETTTDSEGYASFLINFPIGHYTIYSYALEEFSECEMYVPISVFDPEIPGYMSLQYDQYTYGEEFAVLEYGQSISYSVRLLDAAQNPVSNAIIEYSVYNMSSNVTTNNNGRASITLDNLPVGVHNLTVTYPELGLTCNETIYVLAERIPSIIAENMTVVGGTGIEYVVKYTDRLGNPIPNLLVQLTYNYGKPGSYRLGIGNTDENGIFVYSFDLSPGVHPIGTTNSKTNELVKYTLIVLENSSISSENATFDCGSDENNFVMSFTNIDGTPLVNGTVDIIIDDNENAHYVLTTDENGTVSLNLANLPGGNHTITIINLATGEKTSTVINFIKAESSISTSAVATVYNGGKYVVFTLKNSKGAVLSGKDVSVVLNGKTITGVTDSNGQFKVSTDGLVPKSYTASMTFAGDDYLMQSSATVNVVVKKATPKMTAKKATFKAKKKTKKYSIVLKDNKNKAMSKVKVTLKVKGKTYKATTNTKGKATFKITKLTKKGKYTAKVKFAGNKNYNAVTKKVKITVKK